jgi:DNA-binding transcriptional ArsR family regulator
MAAGHLGAFRYLLKYPLTSASISIIGEIWKELDAVAGLSALAQENRLDVFRLLVQAGPEGMPAGEIADTLGIAPNTPTFHFDRLEGLVSVRREGRSLIYAVRYETMNALLGYLTDNCCRERRKNMRHRVAAILRR